VTEIASFELNMLSNLQPILICLSVLFCVASNLITGPIPSEIGLLTSLTKLGLDYNTLTGSIPKEIELLKPSLEAFWFDDNLQNGDFNLSETWLDLPEVLGRFNATAKLMLNPFWKHLSKTSSWELETAMELYLGKYLLSLTKDVAEVANVGVRITQMYPARRCIWGDSLEMLFTIEMLLRSTYVDNRFDSGGIELVLSAFDSPAKQADFISELSTLSSTFDSIQEARVERKGSPLCPERESESIIASDYGTGFEDASSANIRSVVSISAIFIGCFGALTFILASL